MTVQIHAVAFDVFGTLAHGNAAIGPYIKLREYFGFEKDSFRLAAMSQDWNLEELSTQFAGRTLNPIQLKFIQRIEEELREDCAAVSLYDEVVGVLSHLQSIGIPYGIISNLATPYATPVIKLLSDQKLLPPQELCLWSFNEGLLKPNPALYQRFSERVGVSPENILMVGDNRRNDLEGSRAVGYQAKLLNRALRIDLPNSEDLMKDLTGVLAEISIQNRTLNASATSEENKDRDLIPGSILPR